MSPSVTVLMPVHNGGAFLREAVDSILVQTYGDFELLIVDDCSTDDSVAIAGSFSDSRIRIVRSDKRLKLSGVLNLGLDAADGKYIARMDADDVCVPERLELQVEYLNAHPEVGICGGWVKTFGNHPSSGSIFTYPQESEEIRAFSLFDNPFAHPTVMMRKSFLDKFGLRFDGSFYPAEDYELWTRAVECFPSANIGKIFLEYRLHPNSLTLAGKSDMDAQSCRILKRAFAKFGLEPSDDEISFHRLISTNRVPPDCSHTCVEHAELWLLRLLEANSQSGKYSPKAFKRAVDNVWFSVCYHSLTLGWWTVRKYLSSRLNVGTSVNIRRQLILCFSALKKRLLAAR